jgi:hypothetical protein
VPARSVISAFLQKTDHPPFQIKLLFSATIRHSPALPHTAAVAPARDLVLKRIMCDCLSLRSSGVSAVGLDG